MNRWLRRSLFALAGLGIVAGGVTACSRHAWHHGPMAVMSAEDAAKARDRIVRRATDKLELTAPQQQSLGVAVDAWLTQARSLHGGAREREGQLRGLIAGEKFDRATAQRMLDDLRGGLAQNAPGVLQATADFYDGLTPKQQGELRARLEDRGHGPWRRWFGG